MAQINGYKEELQDELNKTDPNSHASRLLTQEIERLEKGDDRKESRSVAFIDVHPQEPQNAGLKVRIPVQEFPRFNFVGKLLGPKGNTLKRLQEETGCKMAILGRGSMRDKSKEEEMRKEGSKKYAHLNDELHVYVEAQAEMTDAYRRLAHAVSELKKFLIPEANDDIRQQQLQEMMYMGDEAPRGGRGGFRGGRGGPAARGGPAPVRGSRGGAPPRGAPSRGGAPMRGASRGRGGGAPPPPPSHSQSSGYDDYGYSGSGYGGSSRGAVGGGGYDEGYDSRGYGESSYGSGQSESQYYGSSGYGSGAQSSAQSYDEYGSYGDYGDSYGNGAGPMKSSSRGGVSKPRTHPYSGGRAAY